MTAETFNKYSAALCLWSGIVCGLGSAYCFLIAPIEYVVLAIVLFGAAIWLELIAALLTRHRITNPRKGRTDEPDAE
jgi:hypothetical protein